MKTHPLKPVLKTHIEHFFKLFQPGDKFRTEDIIKFCKRRMGVTSIYGDTILRYTRELRKEGAIDYEIKCRNSRIVTVI